MFALFTLLLGAISAKQLTCPEQLEQALYRPRSCGDAFFKRLECEFPAKLAQYSILNGFNPDVSSAETGAFCNQLEAENGVIVDLYNAYGQNLCVLKNPTARALAQLWDLLNTKTPDQRFAIYNDFIASYPFPFAIPPPSNSSMDAYGIIGVSGNFTFTMIESDVYNPIPLITDAIKYISTNYPGTIPQDQVDLNAVAEMARIVFALDEADVQSYFNNLILSYGQNLGYDYFNPQQYTFAGLLQLYGIAIANFNNGIIIYPIDIRAENYVMVEARMTQYMTNYGIINGFSQPLPMGGLEGVLCSYGFNQFLPDGKMMRVYWRKQQAILK